jgi:hypothetical protein
MKGNTRFAVLPFLILGKMIFPIQKRLREGKIRKEKLKQKRAEELIQSVRPRK